MAPRAPKARIFGNGNMKRKKMLTRVQKGSISKKDRCQELECNQTLPNGDKCRRTVATVGLGLCKRCNRMRKGNQTWTMVTVVKTMGNGTKLCVQLYGCTVKDCGHASKTPRGHELHYWQKHSPFNEKQVPNRIQRNVRVTAAEQNVPEEVEPQLDAEPNHQEEEPVEPLQNATLDDQALVDNTGVAQLRTELAAALTELDNVKSDRDRRTAENARWAEEVLQGNEERRQLQKTTADLTAQRNEYRRNTEEMRRQQREAALASLRKSVRIRRLQQEARATNDARTKRDEEHQNAVQHLNVSHNRALQEQERDLDKRREEVESQLAEARIKIVELEKARADEKLRAQQNEYRRNAEEMRRQREVTLASLRKSIRIRRLQQEARATNDARTKRDEEHTKAVEELNASHNRALQDQERDLDKRREEVESQLAEMRAKLEESEKAKTEALERNETLQAALDEEIRSARALDADRLARYEFIKQWTNDERRTFEQQFDKWGKNFKEISRVLKSKTTDECVKYYRYFTKGIEKYIKMYRPKKTRRAKSGGSKSGRRGKAASNEDQTETAAEEDEEDEEVEKVEEERKSWHVHENFVDVPAWDPKLVPPKDEYAQDSFESRI